MAKTATSRTGAKAKKPVGASRGKVGDSKAAATKPAADKPRKPAKAAKPAAEKGKRAQKPKAQAQKQPRQERHGAADVVIKLLESPLVVDLIAVGATAALAAITEQRFGRREDQGESSRSAAKAAGKAAAAAMGRRIASEVDQILKASKEAKGDAKS